MSCRRALWRLALTTTLLSAVPCGAASAVAPTVVVRLFIDLQDRPSREAWQRYRSALKPFGRRAQLRVHHLPLARHAHARGAAIAAHVARADGQEEAFIDALLRHPVPDGPAIGRAAGLVGVDRDRLTRVRAAGAGSKVAVAVEADRRSAIAFGVRAAPSALINGRGVAGVPPVAALKRALQRADEECRKARGQTPSAPTDCEMAGARRHAPDAVDALRTLRQGGLPSASAASAAPAGRLDERFRVELDGGELSLGKHSAPVTAVYFADLSDATQRRGLGKLVALSGGPDLRLVILPLPRVDPAGAAVGHAQGLRVALAVVALTAQLGLPERRRLVRGLGDPRLANWTAVEALANALGVAPRALAKGAAAPSTTVMLDRHIRLATAVDARPGALYLNGRRWTGTPADRGLAAAIEVVKKEALAIQARGIPPRLIYPGLIATGRRISVAERDLEPTEAAAVFPGVPDLSSEGEKSGLPVHLFVDFSGLASRAAFHVMDRLRGHAQHPIRLHILSIASAAQPGVTPSGAAFLVAHGHGKGLNAARRIFDLRKPNRWSSLQRALRKLGISLKTLRAEANGPAAVGGAALATKLSRQLEMAEEPVVYIDGRRYVGPIDEGRIEAAVAFASRSRRAGGPRGGTP